MEKNISFFNSETLELKPSKILEIELSKSMQFNTHVYRKKLFTEILRIELMQDQQYSIIDFQASWLQN